MVFGVAQITTLFVDNDQKGLSHRTHMHLQSEGIVRPNNLINFTASNYWKKIIENCKRPARIPDPNNAEQAIAQEVFPFPAWSLMRLKVATVAVEYYSKTSRPLDAANMVWYQRLKKFQVEIISLLEQKKGNHDASFPIISNKLSITNFFDAYDTFAGEYIGENNCLINWVMREEVVVGPATTLAHDQPYSSTYGLVKEEIIWNFSHSQTFYHSDNATVYAQLVISTLGS